MNKTLSLYLNQQKRIFLYVLDILYLYTSIFLQTQWTDLHAVFAKRSTCSRKYL